MAAHFPFKHFQFIILFQKMNVNLAEFDSVKQKNSPDCSGLSLVWGRMKGPQPLHVESAGAALLPRGAPMALPLSISGRKKASGETPEAYFFQEMDASNERLLQLAFIRLL
ncbi:MAG: hypothetical protein IKJ51_10125 [Clostridia bacterium]|nr:hypothetical protein [Clostridia bacterium]